MESRRILYAIILGTSISIISSSNETSSRLLRSPSHKRLVRDLMSTYGSNSVRPLFNSSDPIRVEFFFKPKILSEFNEQNQRLSVVGTIYMGWVDEQLTWDPKDYGGVERISLRIDEIWIPDTTASERLDVGNGYINLFEPYAMINSTGHVSYFDLSDLTVYCRLNMRYFPFDTQRCQISFLSFCYDSDQNVSSSKLNKWWRRCSQTTTLIKLILAYANTSSANENTFAPNGVWKMVDVTVEQVEVNYLCCPNPFVEIHYELILERIGNFYIYSIWLPSGLLSLLIIAVFVMHPNSGEKVSLSVSNVLAFILFQQIVVGSMPQSGDDSPIIVAYFSAMIAISCLSVLGSAVVLRVYHHNPNAPVPWAFRCFIRSSLVNITEERKPQTITNNCRTKNVNDEYNNKRSPEPEQNEVNLFPSSVIGDLKSDSAESHKSKGALDIEQCTLKDTNHRVSPTLTKVMNDMTRCDKETDWMILALMLDKIFLTFAVFAMMGTLLYCVIRFQM